MFKANLEFFTQCCLLQCFILQYSLTFCTFTPKQSIVDKDKQPQKLTILVLASHLGLKTSFVVSHLCLSVTLSTLGTDCTVISCIRKH